MWATAEPIQFFGTESLPLGQLYAKIFLPARNAFMLKI